MSGRSPSLSDQLEQFGAPRFTPYDPETGEGLELRHTPEYGRVIEDGEYAAPGAAAEHLYGLYFKADHETLADGMCRQARAHSRALASHMPVHLSSINGAVWRPIYDENGKELERTRFRLAGDDMLEDQVFQEVGALRRTHARTYVAAVYHTLLGSAEGLKSLILPEYMRASIGAASRLLARTVVYTPWERTTVSSDLISVLNRCGQVWLQCQRNFDTFVAAGLDPKRARLVPPAYDPSDAVAAAWERPRKRWDGIRFYNIGKWEPRKAQHELIGAFLLAFKPGEARSLTLKTSFFGRWADYPGIDESVRVWLGQDAVRERGWTAENVGTHVLIYDKQFSDEQMAMLHTRHDIYVSASHAEGWDYPAFDAKRVGNRLVHVGFGGTEDYAEVHDVALPYRLGPVHPDYDWEAGAEWAHYDHAELVKALRDARPVRPPSVSASLGRYSAPQVGELMHGLLRDLVLAADPELWKAAVDSWRHDAG